MSVQGLKQNGGRGGKGNRWTVTNKTADPTYSGINAQITFSAGTLTINLGRLAVAGVGATGDNFCTINPVGSLTYELLSDAVMYLTWAAQDGGQQDATVTVVARSKDQMVLVGTGGCGFQGIPRISVLTKVP